MYAGRFLEWHFVIHLAFLNVGSRCAAEQRSTLVWNISLAVTESTLAPKSVFGCSQRSLFAELGHRATDWLDQSSEDVRLLAS